MRTCKTNVDAKGWHVRHSPNLLHMVLFTHRAECTWDSELGVRTVNQYRISNEEAGRGTYSPVQWAIAAEGTFAVKVFHRGSLSKQVAFFDENGPTTESMQERVRRELEILAMLGHANIVRLVEVVDDPNVAAMFAIFEGLHGGQLLRFAQKKVAYCAHSDADVVQRYWGAEASSGGSVPELSNLDASEVLVFQEMVSRHLFLGVLEGCAYLHANNVIHKDVKPDNITLTVPVPTADPRFVQILSLQEWPTSAARRSLAGVPTGIEALLARHQVVAKLVDFNSSLHATDPTCTIWDAQGTTLFTPPECFNEASKTGVLGKPRDAWSCGVVLFCLFFGRCPYWAEDALWLQVKIGFEEFSYPKQVLSPASEDLLLQLLKREPGERLSLAAALQHPWFGQRDGNATGA
mmetsp:Transcript_34773/g.78085  ORF Transcript_34773/g.78085 Transcript_34773/m.78085 type:complete len:406 (+) Transcript_34773:12-1229(+)